MSRAVPVALALGSLLSAGCKSGDSSSAELSQASVEQQASPAVQAAVPSPADSPTAGPPAPTSPPPSAPPAWANRKTPDSGIPCEVEEVLAASCRRCHWEPQEHEAPFDMVDWAALQEEYSGKPIHELMEGQLRAELMPPLDLAVEPKVEPLTGEQRQTLLGWLERGAPRSDESCD